MKRTIASLVMIAFWNMSAIGFQDSFPSAGTINNKQTSAKAGAQGLKPTKLGIVITQTDPETVFNVFRLANFALNKKDEVSIFLLGKGVELDRIQDAKFNVREQAETFLKLGGKIMACGTCLKMHNSAGSEICPISTLNDLYELVNKSDRVLTF